LKKAVASALHAATPSAAHKMANKKKRPGLVHVYTGNGKGKTTAALGLALRAIGHGYSAYMIQFLKGGRHIGELLASEDKIKNLTIKQFGKICPYSEEMMNGAIECGNCKDCFLSREEEALKAKEALEFARKTIKSKRYGLVILDEINNTVDKKFLQVEDVIKLIKEKPKEVELVLTGRNAPKEFITLADYATEMKEVKHPFNKGIRVRCGIDY